MSLTSDGLTQGLAILRVESHLMEARAAIPVEDGGGYPAGRECAAAAIWERSRPRPGHQRRLRACQAASSGTPAAEQVSIPIILGNRRRFRRIRERR